MYPIFAIGLLTVILSLMMIVSPKGWSQGILAFAARPYFHIAEILLRFALGAVLLIFAEQTLHPLLFRVMGYLVLAVGVGLIMAGPNRHRAFAVKSAGFTSIFRPAGLFSLAFGIFIIYSALAAQT
jgi:hypothetical protein